MSSQANNLSTLSIIIPCKNEEHYIEKCLDSVVNSDYPQELLEVLIFDGESTDKTLKILERYQRQYSFIKIINNSGGNKAKALNKGINMAKGDILMRLDAHASYAPDYFSILVTSLDEYNADSVGGHRINRPGSDNLIAKNVAAALSSPFGVGNALYNLGAEDVTEVDVTFLFCAKRELFERIGLFDERLTRGQDREFNIRIRENDGKLLLNPKAKCWYYARDNIKDFYNWGFVGGATPVRISRLTNRNLYSFRNFIPPLFFISLFLSTIGSLINPLLGIPAALGLMSYLLAAFYFSISSARKVQNSKLMITLPFVFLLYHFSYSLGFTTEIIKSKK